MSTFSELWTKLARSKKYREHFVAAQVKRAIPLQIRALMEQQELTQAELASRAEISQGTVSRAADPNYGDLTLNTIVRIAAGFDVAFVGRFVPFSELTRFFDTWSELAMRVTPFAKEHDALQKALKAGAELTSQNAKLWLTPPKPVVLKAGHNTAPKESLKDGDETTNMVTRYAEARG